MSISNKLVQAIFFDFDGTLVDSIPVIKNVYFKYLSAIGEKGSDEEFEELNGPNIGQIMEYLKKKYSIEETVESMESTFHDLFANIYQNQVEFFPGAHDFLLWAKGKGFKLVIVTSANPELVKMMLDVKGVRGLFDEIISSKELRNGKPHPEVYEKALREVGVTAEVTVAFEDSEKGIQASLSAGIETFAFGTENHKSGVKGYKDWQSVLKEFEHASD